MTSGEHGKTGLPEVLVAYQRDYLEVLRFMKSLGFRSLPLKSPPFSEATPRMAVPVSPGKEDDPARTLKAMEETLQACTRCKLSRERHALVFGEGSPNADLMFVGEGPGRDEDLQGRPFVGRAGQLLTRIIEAMGLKRPEVYIANIVKCRPPHNRNPEADEIAACLPFLMRQIEVIQPKVVCALGGVAFQTLMETKAPISRFRGTLYPWREGIYLLPTFHPAYLLRNPAKKREVWEDVQKIMAFFKEGGQA